MTNSIKISDINLSDFEFLLLKHSTKNKKGKIVIYKAETIKPCSPNSDPITTESMLIEFNTKHTPKRFSCGHILKFDDLDTTLKKSVKKAILNHMTLQKKSGNQTQTESSIINAIKSYTDAHNNVFLETGIVDGLYDYMRTLDSHNLRMKEATDQKLRMQEIIEMSLESEKTLEKLNVAISILDETSERLKIMTFRLVELKDVAMEQFLSDGELLK